MPSSCRPLNFSLDLDDEAGATTLENHVIHDSSRADRVTPFDLSRLRQMCQTEQRLKKVAFDAFFVREAIRLDFPQITQSNSIWIA